MPFEFGTQQSIVIMDIIPFSAESNFSIKKLVENPKLRFTKKIENIFFTYGHFNYLSYLSSKTISYTGNYYHYNMPGN